MRAGALDRRVEIWQVTQSVDATSRQPKETFSLLSTVWARLVPQNVREPFIAETKHAINEVVWQIRYRTDINEKFQIRHDGKTYRIIGVTPIDRKTILELRTELVK